MAILPASHPGMCTKNNLGGISKGLCHKNNIRIWQGEIYNLFIIEAKLLVAQVCSIDIC
jgi:hypothetical protein